MVSAGSCLSSLSSRALGRLHPRWEPDAVTPLVRICGGGHERSWSLLRLTFVNRLIEVFRSEQGPCLHSPGSRPPCPSRSYTLGSPPPRESTSRERLLFRDLS